MRQIPFLKYRLFFVLISLVAVTASIYLLATKGLNFDTDFKGGTKLLYSFVDPVTESQIRDALKDKIKQKLTVRHFGKPEENRFLIKSEIPPEGEASLSGSLSQALAETFGEGTVTLQQEESVGPKAGKELQRKAQLAILISCLLILIYIGFRFDFMFAPGAIVALIHDILITMGAISLVGRSFSLTSVAALLAILGYSINDTIILYDRVRENAKKAVSESPQEIIELSINHVLSRTLITSLTLLFVVVILFFIAEGDIQDFAFAMIVGAIAGTYSSIFVASPVYLVVRKYWPKLALLFAGKSR